MSYKREPLNEIILRVETDLQSRLFGSSAALRRAVVPILARVIGALYHTLNGFMEWTSKQILPLTSEREYLERHGLDWGVDRKNAVKASGEVLLLGSPLGLVIPIGTLIQRPDGFKYETTEEGIISNSIENGLSSIIKTKALEAGTLGNMDPGTTLELTSSISGVSNITAKTDFSNGAEEEADPEYLARIQFRMQNPNSGGSKTDYKDWATDITGVSDAIIFPLAFGPGSVLVTLGNWDLEPYSVTEEVRAEAEAYIEELRPVTAAVSVVSVVPKNTTILIKLKPNIPEVAAEVEAEIKSLFSRTARPGSTISRTQISNAISNAAGEVDHRIENLNFGGFAVENIILGNTSTALLTNFSTLDL